MKKSPQTKLLSWYKINCRPLPWRQSRNAYSIWISEVMLQQTTVAAVIPYFERFICRFPNLDTLASSPLSEVYKYWAGLGYYSRARNLHSAAKTLSQQKKFPETYKELIQLPGFGPYTSRAVSSIAFSEPVGVLDGNVIRVISRFKGLKLEWWKNKEREKLQTIVDEMVQEHPSHKMNQALMELGATICSPTNPKCIHCPWLMDCKARKMDMIEKIPLSKPKKASERWLLSLEVQTHRDKIYFIRNNYAPFLKGQLLLPGKAKVIKAKPKKYDFRHSITHHEIYVQVRQKKTTMVRSKNSGEWISKNEIPGLVPVSLVTKALRLTTHKDLIAKKNDAANKRKSKLI